MRLAGPEMLRPQDDPRPYGVIDNHAEHSQCGLTIRSARVFSQASVRVVGVEPTRALAPSIASALRLPFRHTRTLRDTRRFRQDRRRLTTHGVPGVDEHRRVGTPTIIHFLRECARKCVACRGRWRRERPSCPGAEDSARHDDHAVVHDRDDPPRVPDVPQRIGAEQYEIRDLAGRDDAERVR